jgi:hypothetical protein
MQVHLPWTTRAEEAESTQCSRYIRVYSLPGRAVRLLRTGTFDALRTTDWRCPPVMHRTVAADGGWQKRETLTWLFALTCNGISPLLQELQLASRICVPRRMQTPVSSSEARKRSAGPGWHFACLCEMTFLAFRPRSVLCRFHHGTRRPASRLPALAFVQTVCHIIEGAGRSQPGALAGMLSAPAPE